MLVTRVPRSRKIRENVRKATLPDFRYRKENYRLRGRFEAVFFENVPTLAVLAGPAQCLFTFMYICMYRGYIFYAKGFFFMYLNIYRTNFADSVDGSRGKSEEYILRDT